MDDKRENAVKERAVEVEGFGVTYDRFMMNNLHRILVKQLNLKNVLESPSYGLKAAGSLYSVGYGLQNCDVTLINPASELLHYWTELGIGDKVHVIKDADYTALPFEDNSFDMAWNFCSFAFLDDQKAWLEEMKRVSKKYIMVITTNNFQLGYPWHRIIHKWYGWSWNHGNTHYGYTGNVKNLFTSAGLRIVESGTIDSPPWPDPVGFRDIRLHKHGDPNSGKDIEWHVPFIENAKKDSFPAWMHALKLYDLNLRKGYWKLPFSHLFYHIAEKVT